MCLPPIRADDHPLRTGVRPWMLALLAAGSTVLATVSGIGLLDPEQPGLPDLLAIAVSAVLCGWLAVGFWTALAGFLLCALDRDPITLGRLPEGSLARTALTGRVPDLGQAVPDRSIDVGGTVPAAAGLTALVMPVCDEDPALFVACLERTCRDLLQGDCHGFEAFVLSDTRDPARQRLEQTALAALLQRLGPGLPIHYRQRRSTGGRKAGNIAAFCRRWGRRYRYLVILDADSVMSGATLRTLVGRMQADPGLGLIQTVPMPFGQRTLFGRAHEFAARVHAPMLAAGQAYWLRGNCNYWGHNAILRTSAFMGDAGLPVLPGKPPLGGEILSHDFVEAALLRRAGWRIALAADLGGSFEHMPSNLIDYAVRDRRWTEGNLQHLRLLAARHLHPLSRLHFLFGALAYLVSLGWLLLLVLGTLDAIDQNRRVHVFFGTGEALFPDWPLPDLSRLYLWLLAFTTGLLLIPRLLAIGLAVGLTGRSSAKPVADSLRMAAGGLVELLLSVLIAPLMMLHHCVGVVSVLVGRSIRWAPQRRKDRTPDWPTCLRQGLPMSLLGGGWALLVGMQAPSLLLWMGPLWLGLLPAPLWLRYTGSLRLGDALVDSRLWPLPATDSGQHPGTAAGLPPGVPPPCPGPMPEQVLTRWRPLQALRRRAGGNGADR